MNKDDLILQIIREVRDEQREFRNELLDIKKTNHENHLNWVEHSRRTSALEKVVDIQGIRIETLEEPEKVNKAIRAKTLKVIAGTTAVLGLLAAAAKVISAFW